MKELVIDSADTDKQQQRTLNEIQEKCIMNIFTLYYHICVHVLSENQWIPKTRRYGSENKQKLQKKNFLWYILYIMLMKKPIESVLH